jgi:hypothetical protein
MKAILAILAAGMAFILSSCEAIKSAGSSLEEWRIRVTVSTQGVESVEVIKPDGK